MRSSECGVKNKIFDTPIGWAGICASEKGICSILLPKRNKREVERELASSECGVRSEEIKSEKILEKTIRLLEKYFSGSSVSFDLPLDIRYYTAFQQAVWRAAMEIPFGETRSYAWIAKKIKRPLAARAVGQAMGANPIPIIIP